MEQKKAAIYDKIGVAVDLGSTTMAVSCIDMAFGDSPSKWG